MRKFGNCIKKGFCILICIIICFTISSSAQTPENISQNYSLVWQDEFNGEVLDFTKWDYRATGSQRKHGLVSNRNSFVNGQGQLVIEVTQEGTKNLIGQIGTQNKYLTKYGYFECRAKMNHEVGPHVAFWLQSPNLNKEGTEIDIFEYHLNEGKHWVYHNLHWGGYAENHKHAGTRVSIQGIDQGYHTFGLEWDENQYIFYVDGKETWRTKEAVSQIPEYIILSAELSGWGGDFSNSNFPDQVYFDYVRVYKKKPAFEQYEKAKKEFEEDPSNPDKLIWYGRRAAYLGNYQEAIDLFSKGVKKYPHDARFLRHRGHRYISTRKYNEAIKDFEEASVIIKDQVNEIEPDGMPNAAGIPVSSLHGNIWYHLGLAYYLKHDYKKAYKAYLKCRESGDNYDNIVSSTNWLYMIQQRMGNSKKANKMLDPIVLDMEVIENHNYYDLCKFYKGLIPLGSIKKVLEDNPAADAVKYGIANWYFYNGKKAEARKIFEEILHGKSTTSFGYLAAESDLSKYYK